MFIQPKTVTHSEEGSTTCFFICPICHQEVSIDVKTTDWEQRQKGQLAIECFTSLADADRELFISGICGVCMDTIDEQEKL